MQHYLVSTLTALSTALLVSGAANAEGMPTMRTLTKGIICTSIEASQQAFDWAADHPTAQYVDLSENPDCSFIAAPTVVLVEPLDLYTNDVAGVVIGRATPPNGDTRYVWMEVRRKPQPATFEQDA